MKPSPPPFGRRRRSTISHGLTDNVVIGEGTRFPGPITGLFPYFDEILQALSPDDPCRFVTFDGFAQVGKTMMANIFTCGSRHDGQRQASSAIRRRQRAALVENEARAR